MDFSIENWAFDQNDMDGWKMRNDWIGLNLINDDNVLEEW